MLAAQETPLIKGALKDAYKECFPDLCEEVRIKERQGKIKGRVESRFSVDASAMFRRPQVQEYYLELQKMDAETAKQVLLEDAVMNDNWRAAEKVIAQEDKLAFRDAAEMWANILVSVGTEVVVPLPGGKETTFPLADMFPKFREASPPPDALRKTIRSIDEFLYKQEHPEDLTLERYRREDFHGFRGGD